MQGGQAGHILPGPTKLGCDRGCIKGRLDVYLHVGFVLVPLLGEQEEMVLDTLVCRCLSFCFPLVYSIGLQVGPQPCNVDLQPELCGLYPLAFSCLVCLVFLVFLVTW